MFIGLVSDLIFCGTLKEIVKFSNFNLNRFLHSSSGRRKSSAILNCSEYGFFHSEFIFRSFNFFITPSIVILFSIFKKNVAK